MKVRISAENIRNGSVQFCHSEGELPGVIRAAGYVRDDLAAIFDARPEDTAGDAASEGCVSETDGVFDLGRVIYKTEESGKREVYSIEISVNAADKKADIHITGSDKRGSIYGLFKLSEFCGISPFINWGDVKPVKKKELVIDVPAGYTSKEPSVEYRGFFINDEWPAFGNFTNNRAGGFNAGIYERVFELLLRLKGNYLWPAMWSAQFYLDGPGLANAELADEMGVVMGTSHHEPCIRNGEEYKYVRGEGSIYGDAWNFRTNREGITRFWEDGLKRSGKYENVITVGMRGEADSTILGKNATLKDNIDLLRDVLKTQNRLIRENVNEDLTKVPRMIALYKEVEPFFYGDAETEGLAGDPELEGVTLMLCDDNHGNLRTVPEVSMRDHNGGYGMYYHFDYHGWPISYEWVGSSALSRTWDQMTNAYESGIRKLWIVNVGDVYSNEFSLAYFLDLAYDYDRWGSSDVNSPVKYTAAFADHMFGQYTDKKTCSDIAELLTAYSRISNNRRPEAMNDNIYAPMAYREREKLEAECLRLLETNSLIEKNASPEMEFPYYEFVSHPLKATLNLQLMWLETTYDHYLTGICAASAADESADRIEEYFAKDKEICARLDWKHFGWWFGMSHSEHIGFTQWNEEECRNPVVSRIHPSRKNRIIAVIPETGAHTEGGDWTKKTLVLPDFVRYNADKAEVYIYAAGNPNNTDFTVEVDGDAIKLDTDDAAGYRELSEGRYLMTASRAVLTFVRNKDAANKFAKLSAFENAQIVIRRELTNIFINVPICEFAAAFPGAGENVFPFADSYVSIEAGHYAAKKDDGEKSFTELPEFGRTVSGMKALPAFADASGKPELYYDCMTKEAGEYRIRFYINPVNPSYRNNESYFTCRVNDGNEERVSFASETFRVTDDCYEWMDGVLDQIRYADMTVSLKKGLNRITVCAGSEAIVLEKLVISEAAVEPQKSYLGAAETYHF